jgi:hypothetical protein
MEIDTIYYKAKDGRLFTDPLKCEDYEKTIGILPGSVGALIVELDKIGKPKAYIFCIVYVKSPDGVKSIYVRNTTCVDDQLESYVNVKDLTQEQRYQYETIGDFIKILRKLDKDSQCQYMIVWSDYINFKEPGIMANHNKDVWKE